MPSEAFAAPGTNILNNMQNTIATACGGQEIGGLAAPTKVCDRWRRAIRACAAFEMSTVDFLRGAIDLFGAPRHGVGVGVIEDGGEPLIEISGELPRAARGGLKRAFAWWERPRRVWAPWANAWAVWHLSRDGYGPRLAIPSLGVLCEVLAARRLGSVA